MRTLLDSFGTIATVVRKCAAERVNFSLTNLHEDRVPKEHLNYLSLVEETVLCCRLSKSRAVKSLVLSGTPSWLSLTHLEYVGHPAV